MRRRRLGSRLRRSGAVLLLRAHGRGDADSARVGRHVLDDDGVGSDRGVVADDDGAEDLRPGSDEHVVADRRVALRLCHRRTAEGDLMVEHDIVADFRGLPDDDSVGVVDEEATPDPGPWVDLHPGQRPHELGHQSRRNLSGIVLPQPVESAVRPDGMHPGVGDQGDEIIARRRIASLHRLEVFSQRLAHTGSAQPKGGRPRSCRGHCPQCLHH